MSAIRKTAGRRRAPTFHLVEAQIRKFGVRRELDGADVVITLKCLTVGDAAWLFREIISGDFKNRLILNIQADT